jgi:hypothetical protein
MLFLFYLGFLLQDSIHLHMKFKHYLYLLMEIRLPVDMIISSLSTQIENNICISTLSSSCLELDADFGSLYTRYAYY